MSKDRQEREVQKQNGTDNPKQHRLALSNQELLICKMIMDPRQPPAFKGCKCYHNYMINKHDSLHWEDLQFAGGEKRNRVSEKITSLRSLCAYPVLYLSLYFHIHYLVSARHAVREETYSYSQPIGGQAQTHKREDLWAVQVHTRESPKGVTSNQHLHS